MANMSYCRFENTSNDFEDCVEALDEAGGIENYIEDASNYEKNGIKKLFELAQRFIEDYENEIERMEK